MNNILTIILGTLGTVLTVLASWGTERLIVWLNGKIKNEKTVGYLTGALNVVTNVVKEVYQTYVENIKDTNAWTEEAQADALNTAMQTAQRMLSTEVKEYIITTFGDLRIWLTSMIEAKIYDLKNGGSI